MGKKTGFLEYAREDSAKQPVSQRVKHFNEFEQLPTVRRLRTQAARCMDCGVPFCNDGCPVQNLIPEFNEYIYQNQWKAAYGTLQSTNNFPEFTGRVCPAPCETSCCAGLVESPVSIKLVEKSIIERAFAEGWVQPDEIPNRSGIKIAVIGSGPAGLAAAVQLNLAGHLVTVFEKNEVLGGLLRLGIPDFKLDKSVVERRIEIMRQSGIQFEVNANVGKNVSVADLKKKFDYICLCGGSEQPRDLAIPGRELSGIHFAMDFLTQQNRINGKRPIPGEEISAKDKHVVVIGGGDTGSDCVGTSNRQGALSVTQVEIMPMPPKERDEVKNPWPQWPQVYRSSTSQDEGCRRLFGILSEEFLGENGKLESIRCVEVDWSNGRPEPKAGSQFELKAHLVLLAMGFVHPVKEGLLAELGVKLDGRGNVETKNFQTSVDNVFAAGDMATGQSLVVRAIFSGRLMAKALDEKIKGRPSHLS